MSFDPSHRIAETYTEGSEIGPKTNGSKLRLGIKA